MPQSALLLQWLVGLVIVAGAIIAGVGWMRRQAQGRKQTVSEERFQRAAEQILGDSSLTDEMDDAEASKVLDWGVAVSKQLVEQVAAQGDEALDEHLGDLRRVVRRINKLAATLGPDASKDEIEEVLTSILEAAGKVPALRVQMPADLKGMVEQMGAKPVGEVVDTVLSLVQKAGEHGEAQ